MFNSSRVSWRGEHLGGAERNATNQLLQTFHFPSDENDQRRSAPEETWSHLRYEGTPFSISSGASSGCRDKPQEEPRQDTTQESWPGLSYIHALSGRVKNHMTQRKQTLILSTQNLQIHEQQKKHSKNPQHMMMFVSSGWKNRQLDILIISQKTNVIFSWALLQFS